MQKTILFFITLLILSSSFNAEEIKTGIIHEKIETMNDKSQSYALYLPSNYDASKAKKWPVIFGFSPNAKGSHPVQLCKAGCEKFGFIVLGSNNSKNGPSEPINEAFKAMTKDAFTRFNIDPEQIYYIGFSGGSRVSLRLADLKENHVKGVIACGAFISPDFQSKNADLTLYGIVGNEDFNYPEYPRAEKLLTESTTRFWFETFSGKHQWPSENLVTEAIEIFDFLNQKKSNKNIQELEKKLLQTRLDKIKKFIKEKHYLYASHSLSKFTQFFALEDSKIAISALMDELTKNQEANEIIKGESDILKNLDGLRNLNDNKEYWDLVDNLKKTALNPGPFKSMAFNALGSIYMSLRRTLQSKETFNKMSAKQKVIYSNLAYQLNEKDLNTGLMACTLYAEQKNTDKVLAIIQQLKNNGFSEYNKISEHKSFAYLKNNETFKNLLK